MSPTKRHGQIEMRYNEDGTLDEVVMMDGKECLFHLEQMSDVTWWMSVTDRDGNMIHINISSKNLRSHVQAIAEEQGNINEYLKLAKSQK